MKKVGVCGHFGGKQKSLDGQTIKTKMLTKELKTIFDSESIMTIDTFNWKKRPFQLLRECFEILKVSESVIILPAHKGIKVFAPVFFLLNKMFHRKLHYVVIGGWLPNLVKKTPLLKIILDKFDGIYVETTPMYESLQNLGLNNVRYLLNFKRLNILEENKLSFPSKEPYRLCTFSRVMKEKGIEEAVEAVRIVNSSNKRIVFELDIYGKVDENYRKRFEEIKREFPEYISYKGAVDFDESVNVLKDYFALLFPTHFKTEGIPGTIIDSYAAGIPVIASKWDSANEIILHNQTGIIYDDSIPLEKILEEVIKDPTDLLNMKRNCIKRAQLYTPEKVMIDFVKYL